MAHLAIMIAKGPSILKKAKNYERSTIDHAAFITELKVALTGGVLQIPTMLSNTLTNERLMNFSHMINFSNPPAS